MTKSLALLLVATCVAAFSVPVVAADATGIDPTRPDTTPRIGGSPADAAFRAAQQESAADTIEDEHVGATVAVTVTDDDPMRSVRHRIGDARREAEGS